MQKHYPAVITPEILAKHQAIPDSEILRDIADTEGELRSLDPLFSVRNRVGFIQYLERVLEARQGRRE